MGFSQRQFEILLRARTGQLNDNGDIMFYDLTMNRFIRIDRNNKLHYYNDKAAVRRAYKLVNYSVKGKYILEQLPDYVCEFNPKIASGFYEKEGESYFNTFEEPKAFALKRAKEHKSLDISFLENYKYFNILLRNLFVKDEYLEYFVNWLSVIINERIKTRTTIILKGIEGTGKGLLENELIIPIFSDKYTVTIENESLRSQFNGELEEKLFVIFNEIKGDFRESATLYEKLKIYISDPTISINNKYGWAGTTDNYFNCIFYSNNSLPVQISPTDRRYSVFNTSSTPLEKICDSMGITTDDFVAGLRKERDSFIRDLFSYNYEISRACRVLNTEEKMIIAEATTPKLQLVSNKLKEQNFEWLYDKGIEILETMKMDINNTTLENIIGTIEEKFPVILEEHLTQGYLLSEDLIILYRLFVNMEETSSIKISNAWTPYLGKSKLKKINGKPVRVRVVGNKKEWNKGEVEMNKNNNAVDTVETKETKETMKVMNEVVEEAQSSKEENKDSIFTEEFDAMLNESTTKKEKSVVNDFKEFKERRELTTKVQQAQNNDPLSEISEEDFDAIVNAAYGNSNRTFGDLLASKSA